MSCAATLPWQERVKRSIETFENERDEVRLQQQVIGKQVLRFSVTHPYSVLKGHLNNGEADTATPIPEMLIFKTQARPINV
jgi:hypothetical protein